ncbi:MAG: CHRD domain-containing protein [Ginsengibacter sp.]
MKKILQTTMIGFLVILVACNDSGSSKTDESTTTTDTSSAMVNDNTTAVTNNLMTGTGLQMKADQEVPVNKSTASGTADVTYNKDTKMLTYTLNWSGLTGKATMAHIHGTAPRGTNAGVKHDLTPVLKKETSGSFTDSVKIDASDIKEDSLLSGFYYFNIHTPANPGGEIRAQIDLK